MKCENENEEILNNEVKAERIIQENKYFNNSIDKNDKKNCDSLNMKKYENSKVNYFIYTFVAMLIMGILVYLVNFILESSIFSNSNLLFKTDKTIKQPLSDYKKYRSLYLKNGLQAIIISDPLSTLSGASLSVGVGSTADPKELYGLAHFCEHMLFLGSRKYPNGDDYFKTITENNGKFNAYTDREITNYFFEIHYFSFEYALDIFSRFFIDPLFKEEKLNKEINSVNSEYEKNLIIDNRKKSSIYAYIANEDDPYHRFTTGNIDSLVKSAEKNGLNLRDELIKFHKKYYTADKMRLVIYTKEDLDDMEEIIIDKFSQIMPSAEFKETIENQKNREKGLIKDSNNTKNNQSQLNKNFLKKIPSKDNIFSEENINSEEKYSFKSPFDKKLFGSIISFEALTQENELTINFIQKSLRSHSNFKVNPSLYFSFIIDSKEENSLVDRLKKSSFATKLHLNIDREYNRWSDLSLEITLTKNGMENLSKVLEIVSNYLDYMRRNFINKEYFDYLKKIENLKFQEKNILSQSVFDIISKLGARAHNYPLPFLLYDNIFVGEYNKEVLEDYAKNINLEISIIFIPAKLFEKNLKNYSFLEEIGKYFEPWYKTSYKIFKINFDNLNFENKEQKSFSPPELYEKESINKILNNMTFKCDKKCLMRLKNFDIKEPNLLNKTAVFELWHKKEFTLDFNKMIMEIQFIYDTYKKPEEKVYLNLFQTHIKRKLKKFNFKIKSLSNSLSISIDNSGLKLSFVCINEPSLQNKLFEDLSEKIYNSFRDEVSEFNLVLQETKEKLRKEYNSQPYVLAYDYFKDNILEDHIRLDEEMQILKNVTKEKFDEFVDRFEKNVYFKILFFGNVEEKQTREIFKKFKNFLSLPLPSQPKKIFSIKEKRAKNKPSLKIDSGNYLIRKIYHSEKNKNNCLLKCFYIDKKNYKSEILIKLFHGIIGNIVFRELRINKQFGYVAKSRLEVFNDQIFYCIFVQGSSKLPHIIDDAAEEVLKMIRNNINKMSSNEFTLAKRKNFDTVSSSRLDLVKISSRYFNTIIGNKYNFYNFLNMENYSKSITEQDFKAFFDKNFFSEKAIKLTVYMYSKNTNPSDRKLNPLLYSQYEELADESDENDISTLLKK